MSKLMIYTQYKENYGTVAEPYWKFKGGSEYIVLGVDECDMIDVIVDRVRPQVEISNPMCEEYILGYQVVADDYLTEYERSQLEWYGKITFPAEVLIAEEA
jgi:hypothetical protein